MCSLASSWRSRSGGRLGTRRGVETVLRGPYNPTTPSCVATGLQTHGRADPKTGPTDTAHTQMSLTSRFAIAAMLACVVTTSLDATTLVILRTPREIVVAADSLLSLYGRRPQQVCKIGRHGDTVFATAGLVESQDGVLDVHAVIAQVLRRNVSWIEHVRTIKRRLQEPLLRTLRRMRRELPDEFRALAGGGFALHVSLAAFRDGTARLETREFFVEAGDTGRMRLRVRRVSCPADCAGTVNVFGVGETEAMMRHVDQLARYPADLATLAYDLVDLQVGATPAVVGPPIDVIRVNAAGVAWSARKASCAR